MHTGRHGAVTVISESQVSNLKDGAWNVIIQQAQGHGLIQASESIYPVVAFVGALVGALVATGGLVTL